VAHVKEEQIVQRREGIAHASKRFLASKSKREYIALNLKDFQRVLTL